MKFTRKNASICFAFVLFSVVIGTVGWEVFERILALFGAQFDASVGPLGFDLYVIAVSLRGNPGTILGLAGGILLFALL